MKNRLGPQFKRLNRTPKHRANLIKNMTALLVSHERIQTTVAKAKFIQFHAEKLIYLALQEKWSCAAKVLSQPARHIPKLAQIAARHVGLKNVATRIILNGTRGGRPNADQAPLAILEFCHGPNSAATALAFLHRDEAHKRLLAVEDKLYEKLVTTLTDPMTGSDKDFVQLYERPMIKHIKQKLQREERKYQNLYHNYSQEIQAVEIADGNSIAHELRLKSLAAVYVKSLVDQAQRLFDTSDRRTILMMKRLQFQGLTIVSGKVIARELAAPPAVASKVRQSRIDNAASAAIINSTEKAPPLTTARGRLTGIFNRFLNK